MAASFLSHTMKQLFIRANSEKEGKRIGLLILIKSYGQRPHNRLCYIVR